MQPPRREAARLLRQRWLPGYALRCQRESCELPILPPSHLECPQAILQGRDEFLSAINYAEVDSVPEALQEMVGGHGPDACIHAVAWTRTERGCSIRLCERAARYRYGACTGAMDKFPVGVMMNKRLTVRTAQQHGQKYVPKLLSTPSKVSWTHLPWRRTGYPWSNPCGDTTCSRTKPRIVG
jgi:hypothetical protein